MNKVRNKKDNAFVTIFKGSWMNSIWPQSEEASAHENDLFENNL
jgi:hypothetical protein